MKTNLILIAFGLVVAATMTWWWSDGLGAWNPEQREIVVRQVSNGYVVIHRTRDNPYPIKESIAPTSQAASEQVKAYLDTVVLGRGRTR